jgi:hypothetical protein
MRANRLVLQGQIDFFMPDFNFSMDTMMLPGALPGQTQGQQGQAQGGSKWTGA